MKGLRLLGIAWVPLAVAGCITVQTFGGRPQPLVETVVDGKTGPKVVLLDIDGFISEVSLPGPLGFPGRDSSIERLREQLDKAGKDVAVKGLLLRVNSPGGTVTASDMIHREILEFKRQKGIPVVAQLMGVAASGGYYVAMAADVVFAHPTTITGSIGVVSQGINLSGLMERYGVTDQTLTSGPFKDAGSALRPMTYEERAYLQAVIDDLHRRFQRVVDEGRPALDAAQIGALADGRVFTASQAEAHGLVDAIGYIPAAVDELRRRVQAADLRVVTYHREREYRANLYSMSAASSLPVPEVSDLLAGRGPGFLYLWQPGLQLR